MAASFNLKLISWDTLLTSHGDDKDFLGKGSYSVVYRCYHNSLGDVAVKILNRSGENQIHSFTEEGKIHFEASTHENIVTVFGFSQRMGFLGLVLEYMPYGSLASLIYNKTIDVPWTFRLRAMTETASALAYLHNLSEQEKVVHCDIKSENILLDPDLHVKISDFGGARLASYTGGTFETTVSAATRRERERSAQYTESHTAPERLEQCDVRHTTKMDVYSFSIVLYTVASRLLPFQGVRSESIHIYVLRGQRPMAGLSEIEKAFQESNQQDASIFKLLKDLMTQGWAQKPEDRPTMVEIRDALCHKLRTCSEVQISQEVTALKSKMKKHPTGCPQNPVTIYEKYTEVFERQPLYFLQAPALPPPQSPVTSYVNEAYGDEQQQNEFAHEPRQELHEANQSANFYASNPVTAIARSFLPEQRKTVVQAESTCDSGMEELERSFADPYFRVGNTVKLISDVAAVKNAHTSHGGWTDAITNSLDTEGKVIDVDDKGDVTVSFPNNQSHTFDASALIKILGKEDLIVGDFVAVTLERDLVEAMQKDHGGWTEQMCEYFYQLGVVVRFLPEKDVVVAYKGGMYFRYNLNILTKCDNCSEFSRSLCLSGNPNVKIGDYVYHDLEEDVFKMMQQPFGECSEEMSELRGRVGKFVYVDSLGGALVAYSSKQCYILNPGTITKLSNMEASKRYQESEKLKAKVVQQKAAIQAKQHGIAVGDQVRIDLPLDIVIELQRDHGEWCYQMLEVYGQIGVVKGFDEEGAEVEFSGKKTWIFNPEALEKIPESGTVPPPSYTPPFNIGDKVRVQLKEVTNDAITAFSLNLVIKTFSKLDMLDDECKVLVKSGKVLGIDKDMDVVVLYDDEKVYRVKPNLLKKL